MRQLKRLLLSKKPKKLKGGEKRAAIKNTAASARQQALPQTGNGNSQLGLLGALSLGMVGNCSPVSELLPIVEGNRLEEVGWKLCQPFL